MAIRKYNDIEEIDVTMDGISGVTKRIPISKPEGWKDYTLRVFKIKPGGNTPAHQHDWEHVNYIMAGRGKLMIDGTEYDVSKKDFALVPPNKKHQFRNPYDEDFEFICIVPNRGES